MLDDDLSEAKSLTPKENIRIMRNLIKDWTLIPAVAHDNQQLNTKDWKRLADRLYITLSEARRLSCASCEYGNISPKYLKAMEHVPYNKFDKDGGIRVWCDKFDFICHATRCCSAYSEEEDND